MSSVIAPSLSSIAINMDVFLVVMTDKIPADLTFAPNVFIPYTRSDSRRDHSRALIRTTLYQRSFFTLTCMEGVPWYPTFGFSALAF